MSPLSFSILYYQGADLGGRAIYAWLCRRTLAGIAGLSPDGAWNCLL